MATVLTLAELAERFGLEIRGDEEAQIDGVCTLEPGRPGGLTFVATGAYLKQLAATRASAVVLAAPHAEGWDGNALISPDPQADYARIAQLFDATARPATAGVHPSACIDETADVDPTAEIAAGVVIGAGSRIAANCRIGPGCVVGEGVALGESSCLVASVTLCDGVTIGRNAHFQPGVVVGGRGYGLAPVDGGWLEVPQLGSVRIGNDVELGANTCVDRGAIEDTVIEDGVKIDNLVQVGHNSVIGAHTAIAGCVGIAGSARIGRHCQIGGGAGIADHVHIADNVVVAGMSLVSNSIKVPGLYSASLPAQPAAKWRRQLARLRKIDDLAARIRKLEKKE